MPDYTKQNEQYIAPGEHTYNTPLSPDEEKQFRAWAAERNVPFDFEAPVTDYDMRGFYKAYTAGDSRARSGLNVNDGSMHYPDYWKTPYHQSFSNESQWAVPYAPKWNDMDQLVDQNGNIVYDERAANRRK